MYDTSIAHHSYILADSFKYSHIIIATTTYNNSIFVKMEQFLSDVVSHNLQNRTFAIIENGSWAPNAGNSVQKMLEVLKGSKFIENKVTIKSALKNNQETEIENLANEIIKDIKN